MALIPCESLSEYEVNEIFNDGRELIIKPLTPSDNFQRIVNQIDFEEDINSKTKGEESNVIPAEIFTTVRESIRNAFCETCALVDVLSIVLDNRFIKLNPILNESLPYKLSLVLSGKKIALAGAAQILQRGAERLRTHLNYMAAYRGATKNDDGTTDNTNAVPSFHLALINLRKYWRLRIFQNSILGDISLTSAGSRFRESGAFEIREANPLLSSKCPVEIVFNRTLLNVMERAIYPGMLLVRIQKLDANDSDKNESLLWHSVFKPDEEEFSYRGYTKTIDLNVPPESLDDVHDRLNFAQRVLSCREIISNLSNEASFSRFPGLLSAGCMAFATQDEVVASLFPGVQVSVKLLTKESNSSDFVLNSPEHSQNINSDYSRLPDILQVSDSKNSISDNIMHQKSSEQTPITSLAIQLMRILHDHQKSSWSNLSSVPNPVTTPVQVPKSLRAAGAQAIGADALVDGREIASSMVSSSIQIGVAAVAGFAGPASAAWIASAKNSSANLTSTLNVAPGNANILKNIVNVPPLNQERHNLFSQWSNFENKDDQTGSFADTNANHVTAYESALMRSGAGQIAMETTLGMGTTMLGKFVHACRHYVLRQEVAEMLTSFSRSSPFCLNVLWNGLNSAICSTARLQMFYRGYETYKLRLALTVETEWIYAHLANPPRRITLSLNNLSNFILEQIMHMQLEFLQMICLHLLGWTYIAFNSYAAQQISDQNEKISTPYGLFLIASPNVKYSVLFKVTDSGLVSCYVADLLECFDSKNNETDFHQVLEQYENDLRQAAQRLVRNSLKSEFSETSDKPMKSINSESVSSLDLIKSQFAAYSKKPQSIKNDELVEQMSNFFREVDLSRINGQNILEKVEALLVSLDTKFKSYESKT